MRAVQVLCPIFSTLAGSFNQYDMPDCVLVSVVDGIWEGLLILHIQNNQKIHWQVFFAVDL